VKVSGFSSVASFIPDKKETDNVEWDDDNPQSYFPLAKKFSAAAGFLPYKRFSAAAGLIPDKRFSAAAGFLPYKRFSAAAGLIPDKRFSAAAGFLPNLKRFSAAAGFLPTDKKFSAAAGLIPDKRFSSAAGFLPMRKRRETGLDDLGGDRVKRDTFSFGDMDSALVGAQRPRFGKRVVPEHLMPAASDYGWGSDGLDKRYGASSGFLEGFNDLEGMQRPRFGRRR